MSDIEVHMGDIAVMKGAHNLITSGVGSCLVITLHDAKLQIGALAHTMVPSSAKRETEYGQRMSARLSSKTSSDGQACLVKERVSTKTKETKYVDVAIDQMLKGLEANGAKRKDLEAKLIGGANMFPSIASDDIGKDNVLSAKDKLNAKGIRIVGECVGGSQGRSVEFSPTTGIVTVKIKF
ncbi:MAG: chemotaxis protein CheD [Phycisphaerae bacterium]